MESKYLRGSFKNAILTSIEKRHLFQWPGGGREGINRHGELAVVEQVKRAEQLTADRDL